ncbi:single-stranded-DNA-specific exonuclease RecJ [Sporolactobacillus sp. THM19-2]|uniref:single-stranded-DNA-specific exonuclease RecJ n=1 Tax=Sporolactobacillus sp. THM19-2 TaxID=2511171 RepID=UPI001F0D6804|nr:single-stranded-DNA-specific exonuclease RecJ [Sporolactobacillus sp. THM19-2]
MLQPENRWITKQADTKKVRELAEDLHISSLTARLLVLRGIDNPEHAELFLHPEKMTFHDPMRMLGMREAVDRISRSAARRRKIRIFGDYDADGVTSTALLVRALSMTGAEVSWHVPNRFTEGYGPHAAAVEQAKKDGIDLIVTVDSGIAAYEAADRARQLGIDYVITDHHEPPAVLPDASTILNPKQPGCDYPFKGLSGAGVALKLTQALFGKKADPQWLALAAIGTIADLVPLRDENRLIAYQGLKRINEGTYPGINALKFRSGGKGDADSDTIGFQLGPRLNAAGRLEDAEPAVRLLLTGDETEASALADRLDKLNQERKALADRIFREADQMAASFIQRGDQALVLPGVNWNQGVIGLAASKIVEKYYRPTIILAVNEEKGVAKGSGRSIDGVNLYKALTDSSDHLAQFGGHQMAAGLSLPATEIDDFRSDFLKAVRHQITPDMLIKKAIIEDTCQPDQITVELIEQLGQLAPFGTDNAKPLCLMDHIPLTKISAVGRDASHLKLTVRGDSAELDGIGFGMGHKRADISPADRISMIGEWQINEWNGFKKPQMLIRDIKVDGLQVFDWRDERRLKEKLEKISPDEAEMIAFQEHTAERLQLSRAVKRCSGEQPVRKPALVLLDLPDELEQLTGLIDRCTEVNRIYTVFHHAHDHYFSTFPTRNHFVWYYALIRQEHSFKLDETAKQIARFKGWPERMVYFMTKVFFELDFVTIDNGVLTVNPASGKTPLSDSVTYRREKSQLEMEDLFCYSPISRLKSWFEEKMKHRKQADEPEGTIHGL